MRAADEARPSRDHAGANATAAGRDGAQETWRPIELHDSSSIDLHHLPIDDAPEAHLERALHLGHVQVLRGELPADDSVEESSAY